MTKSFVYSAFALFLLAALTQQLVSTQEYELAYFNEKKAFNLWMTKIFLESCYQKLDILTDADISEGENLYKELKFPDLLETGMSGMVSELDTSRLTELVNIWKDQNLISQGEMEEEELILSPSDRKLKTIREHTFVRDNGDIVYGIIGYIQLINAKPTMSVVYSFRKFKLNGVSPEISYVREDDNCALWGIFCKTTFSVSGTEHEISEGETTNLFGYMRSEILKQFSQEYSNGLKYLDSEAERYSRFLASSYTDAYKIISENSDKRLDELFTEDPFDANKFEL